jgi:CheY-like chemotaxis protein
VHRLSHIARVLVIEDEYLIAAEIMDLLRSHGVQSAEAVPSSTEALRRIGQGGIDCATVDVSLLDGDCQNVVDQLKAASIPFIYVSGHAPDGFGRLPPAAWLEKPVEDEVLVAALLAVRSAPAALNFQTDDQRDLHDA